jgi:hypothetical protein
MRTMRRIVSMVARMRMASSRLAPDARGAPHGQRPEPGFAAAVYSLDRYG